MPALRHLTWALLTASLVVGLAALVRINLFHAATGGFQAALTTEGDGGGVLVPPLVDADHVCRFTSVTLAASGP